MLEGIRKNKFPGKTKEDLAFDCDMYIYYCLICPSILVQPCPKECTVHPDNFCQLRTSWRSLLSWQVGFFFHFPFYIWMYCMKINSPSHNQSPETGWLHCRHRLLLQVWQLMIPRTEWDSLITVVRKGTTRKTQCDEDNFCLLVKIRLENTSHTCIFFIQLLVWWSLDDLWLSSLGSCLCKGKSQTLLLWHTLFQSTTFTYDRGGRILPRLEAERKRCQLCWFCLGKKSSCCHRICHQASMHNDKGG